MEMVEINKLIPHSQNDTFFDDITGENWKEFLESIKTSGVIEPIVISQDKIIISGHQRVRACKELGIKQIACRIKMYDKIGKWNKEELIVKELLETNLRQRGLGNTNPIKLARCVIELEKLYGIKKGSNQHSLRNNFVSKTQDQLSQEIGIDKRQLQNYKKLLNLIPELQDLVQEQKLSASTAYKIYAKLTQDEQKKLLLDLGVEKISQMTKNETEKEVEQLTKENENLKIKEKEWIDELNKVKKQKQEVKEVETIIEHDVYPEDYHQIKNELKMLKQSKNIQYNSSNINVNEKDYLEKFKFNFDKFRKNLQDCSILINPYLFMDNYYVKMNDDYKKYLLKEVQKFEKEMHELKDQILYCKGVTNG